MSCSKCNEEFVLKESHSRIYWMSGSDELNYKIKTFLESLKVTIEENQSLLYVEVENTKEFFIQNNDAIVKFFSYIERAEIKIFVAYPNEEFSFSSILKAKPLQIFINLIEDEDFFYIVNNESLMFEFQAIYDVHNEKIFGYEALVRGINKDGTTMHPTKLFSKSKRNGFDFKLDRLCREMALKAAAEKNIQKKLFINFIPTSIYDPKFCLFSTVRWSKHLNFDAKNVIFEVVQAESVKDKPHLKNILNYYRDEGFEVALDNVGEENSELNMMIKLKPNIIKVDRNILQNIHSDAFKQSTYKALYLLAKENGIKVLALKVESKQELQTILELGVDYVQGYYISRPKVDPELYVPELSKKVF